MNILKPICTTGVKEMKCPQRGNVIPANIGQNLKRPCTPKCKNTFFFLSSVFLFFSPLDLNDLRATCFALETYSWWDVFSRFDILTFFMAFNLWVGIFRTLCLSSCQKNPVFLFNHRLKMWCLFWPCVVICQSNYQSKKNTHNLIRLIQRLTLI